MKQALAALFGLVLAVSCASPAKPVGPYDETLFYRVGPVQNGAGEFLGLSVSVSFNLDADGSTDIYLPSRYAGFTDIWQNFTDLSVSGGTLTASDDPAIWTITSDPSARVTFSYRANSAISHPPTGDDEQPYVPWILPTWFFVDTVTLFARPHIARETPAVFAWEGDPSIIFASDLEGASTPNDGLTMQTARDGVLFGGDDVRVVSRGSTRIALRGAFSFDDETLVSLAANAIAAVRAYWGEPSDAPFLIAVASLPPSPGSRGGFAGSSLGDAFLATISGDVDLPRLLSTLFTHEVQHAWLPAALGDPRVSQGEAWFGEGFSEYLARAVAMRAGVITLDEFAALWNADLVAYMASPARNYPNQRLTDEFWSNHYSGQMPYLRGAIAAAMWDRYLRNRSAGRHSLDDVLQEQRKRAKHVQESPPDAENSFGRLFVKVAGEFGLDVRPDMAAYIEEGRTIWLPPDTFGPCFRMETTAVAEGLAQKLVREPGSPDNAQDCQLAWPSHPELPFRLVNKP